MRKSLVEYTITRRQLLKGSLGVAGGLILPAGFSHAEDPATMLDTVDNLYCVYVNRATGKVVAVKSFAEVNPEIAEGKTAATPYKPPNKNVYIGRASTLFTQDIKRYAIVDIEKRNEGLGFFSQLKDSYLPDEYTHHFLLTLADRELGREELGAWALDTATAPQKQTALDLLRRIHKGTNGAYVTDDPDKMAEATRFYTGRELLKPMLYLGTAPQIGELAMIGWDGIEVASNGDLQLALAGDGRLTGGIDVGDGAANDMSVAAKGATEGTVSSVAAAIGGAAGVGAKSGGSSDSGDGGSGSGGGGSSSSGGSSCFTADTGVWMADGGYKPIALIEIGDEVVSYDTKARRQTTSRVTKLFHGQSDHVLNMDVNGHALHTTHGHPFAGPNGDWITAGNLRAGSTLVTSDGETTLHNITRQDRPTDIFNMTVDSTHTYYVVPGSAPGCGAGDREPGNVRSASTTRAVMVEPAAAAAASKYAEDGYSGNVPTFSSTTRARQVAAAAAAANNLTEDREPHSHVTPPDGGSAAEHLGAQQGSQRWQRRRLSPSSSTTRAGDRTAATASNTAQPVLVHNKGDGGAGGDTGA